MITLEWAISWYYQIWNLLTLSFWWSYIMTQAVTWPWGISRDEPRGKILFDATMLDIWWENKDYSMCQIVQNKRVLLENKARQIFRKTNNSYPLIRTLACTYQGIRNVRFSENLMCFVFLVTPVLRFALLSFYLRFLHCLFLRPHELGIGKLLIS